MSSLLAVEWIKLRHRWMPRILVLIMLAIISLITLASLGRHDLRTDLYFPKGLIAGLTFAGFLSPFLWPVLAGAWPGNEFSWGTIRMVLSRRPNRVEQCLAGLIMVTVFVAAALLIAMIFSGIIGLILSLGFTHHAVDNTGVQSGFGFNLVKVFLAEVYAVGLYVVIAYAAGTIFASPAAGIGIGIGSWIAQEVLRGIFIGALGGTWAKIADHLPNSYIAALPQRIMGGAVRGHFFSPDSRAPGVGEDIIGIAVYMAVLIGITLLITTRRDVTA